MGQTAGLAWGLLFRDNVKPSHILSLAGFQQAPESLDVDEELSPLLSHPYQPLFLDLKVICRHPVWDHWQELESGQPTTGMSSADKKRMVWGGGNCERLDRGWWWDKGSPVLPETKRQSHHCTEVKCFWDGKKQQQKNVLPGQTRCSLYYSVRHLERERQMEKPRSNFVERL